MPFKSKAQQRFMYSQHPEIAKRWQKKTPKGKELPEKVKNHEDLDAFLEVIEQHLKEARERWSWTRNFMKHSTTGQKIAAGGLIGGTAIGAYSGGQREWRKTRKKSRKRYMGKLARASKVFGGAAKGAISGAIGGAITGYGVGHAADYISRGSNPAAESIDEGAYAKIKDKLNNLRSRLKASKKIYKNLNRGGTAGRTPEEIKLFVKKASLYKNFVTAGKATAALGGAAVITGGTLGYIKHKKRQKAELAKLSGKERALYKKALKKRSRGRWAAARAGALIGGTAGFFAPIPIDISRPRNATARIAGVTVGGAAAGALTGYIAKMAAQPSKKKLRASSKRKANRYESMEDVINSLLHEEDDSEN